MNRWWKFRCGPLKIHIGNLAVSTKAAAKLVGALTDIGVCLRRECVQRRFLDGKQEITTRNKKVLKAAWQLLSPRSLFILLFDNFGFSQGLAAVQQNKPVFLQVIRACPSRFQPFNRVILTHTFLGIVYCPGLAPGIAES